MRRRASIIRHHDDHDFQRDAESLSISLNLPVGLLGEICSLHECVDTQLHSCDSPIGRHWVLFAHLEHGWPNLAYAVHPFTHKRLGSFASLYSKMHAFAHFLAQKRHVSAA